VRVEDDRREDDPQAPEERSDVGPPTDERQHQRQRGRTRNGAKRSAASGR